MGTWHSKRMSDEPKRKEGQVELYEKDDCMDHGADYAHDGHAGRHCCGEPGAGAGWQLC